MLPVLIRELQVEARHSFTYWLRVLGAGALVLVGAYGVLGHGLSMNKGGPLFARLHLTLLCSIWVLVPLVTADCISRERREGTLGLLFLTPLTARGIVMAKGLAHGLRAMTLCLAVLPVLMIPFLMGGVSWQEALLSLATNFSSFCWALAAGLLASAQTKNWLRALVLAVALSIIFGVCFGMLNVLVVVYRIIANVRGTRWAGFTTDIFGLAFPLATNVGQEWKAIFAVYPKAVQIGVLWSVALVAALSLIFLLAILKLAALSLRRRWQEEPPSARQLRWQRFFCTPVVWVGLFRRWMRWKLEHNPIGWLEQRTWSARLIMWSWFAIIASLDTYAADLFRRDFDAVQGFFAWLLTGSIALSAAGSFRRERETGVLELLLVSPLTTGQIINGRLRGLWAQFLPASLVLFGVWLYFASVFKEDRHPEWLWIYACTFFTLPIIGLYFSLQQKHFISALLWTVATAIVLPLLLSALSEDIDLVLLAVGGPPYSPGVRRFVVASATQIILAIALGRKLNRNLARRSFAFQ